MLIAMGIAPVFKHPVKRVQYWLTAVIPPTTLFTTAIGTVN
jgi:hypothetical protein